MFNFLVALVLANPVPQAVDLSAHGKYEESEAVLQGVKIPGGKDYELYAFARLLNNFALNNKEEAAKYAKMLDDSFTSTLPTRYKALAYMMQRDLEQWTTDGLDDIARDMKKSADRLKDAKGGEKTQAVQKQIVDKLDRMIKEQEDKKNAQANAQGKGEDGKPLPGTPAGQQGPQNAPDSVIMGGDGKGKVDEKKLRNIAETWGTLPPAKRAAVVQEITRDLPEKFRPMIEEYFKALNRVNPPSRP